MEVPAPPPVMTAPPFMADRIIGIVIMAFAGLSFLGGLFFIFMGRFLGSAMDQMTREDAKQHLPTGDPGFAPMTQQFSIFAIAGWIVLAVALLQLLSGIGVFRGSRKGMIFALILAAPSLAGGHVGSVLSVGIGLYVILRLWGNVGPKPA